MEFYNNFYLITPLKGPKTSVFLTIYLCGRKDDREIILGVFIKHIFKYITNKFCRKILQNGDTAAILPRHVGVKFSNKKIENC